MLPLMATPTSDGFELLTTEKPTSVGSPGLLGNAGVLATLLTMTMLEKASDAPKFPIIGI